MLVWRLKSVGQKGDGVSTLGFVYWLESLLVISNRNSNNSSNSLILIEKPNERN